MNLEKTWDNMRWLHPWRSCMIQPCEYGEVREKPQKIWKSETYIDLLQFDAWSRDQSVQNVLGMSNLRHFKLGRRPLHKDGSADRACPGLGDEFGALQSMRKYQKSQEIIRNHKQSQEVKDDTRSCWKVSEVVLQSKEKPNWKKCGTMAWRHWALHPCGPTPW